MKFKFSLVIFLWMFFSVTEALSCTCRASNTHIFYRKASTVFIGKVVRIGNGTKSSNGLALYPITFMIEKSWKGVKESEITISTSDVDIPETSRICGGFNFAEGETYLVYAYGKELSVGTCSCCPPTEPVKSESANAEIKRLNSFWFRLRARFIPF